MQADGCFPADYPIADVKADSTKTKKTVPLDPHHSHFILVDNGDRDKFGGEIQWRAEFEDFLSRHVFDNDDGMTRDK